MQLVGRIPRTQLAGGAMIRLRWPPFDVVVAMPGDVPYAIEDACNHAGASLAEGELRGSCVACPMHGYTFDLATGRLIEPRGLCADQRAYVARVEGDDVIVWDPGTDVRIVGL